MTFDKMQELLSKDEKITIEYKECVNQIHDSVYETVSAFPIDMADILLWVFRMVVFLLG